MVAELEMMGLGDRMNWFVQVALADSALVWCEELDVYAANSHEKTHTAYESGRYADEVLPLEVEEALELEV